MAKPSDRKRTLTQNIVSAHKDGGQKWIDQLPNLLQKLADRWQIQSLQEYDNLSWNYVVQGIQAGRPVALKMSYDLLSLKKEVNALTVFAPGSCVQLLDFDETNIAALIEAATPGRDLLNCPMPNALASVSICCDVALRIKNNQKPHAFSFEPIQDELKNIEKDWNIPSRILTTARELKIQLLASQTDTYIIHGDLHRGNILSHGDSWRAIDPKGYIGTLYNEVWPFVHNPRTEIPWIAKKLGLEEKRLIRWCFLHSVLAATWCLEDGIDPKNVLDLAEMLLSLL
jgi:streptomycin 6-kinase